MKRFFVFFALIYSSIAMAEEPYPLVGKNLYAVNLNAKTCNEIVFKNDMTFQFQVNEKNLVSGKYSYDSGILKLVNTDGSENSKLSFQKVQEVDGKLAVTMKDLNVSDNVNIYVNKKFCETTGFPMKNLKQEPAKQAVSANAKGGWIYAYTSTISGDNVKKEIEKQCQSVPEGSFEIWWHNKRTEMTKKQFTCIEPMKSSSGEYFANNFGCNISKMPNGKVISMASAIRTQGAVVSTYMGRWFTDQNECEKARATEPIN